MIKSNIPQIAPGTERRLIEYSTAGTFGILLDLAILYLLVNHFGMFYVLSAVISFTIATIMSYSINRNYAFKGTKRHPLRGYIYFLIIHLITLGAIILIMAFLVEIINVRYLPARIIAGLVVGLFDFIANSRFTFSTPIFVQNKKYGKRNKYSKRR